MDAWDAHTHLDQHPDPHGAAARARAAGVTGLTLAAADPDRWDQVAALGEALGVPWSMGVHPWWATPDRDLDAALAALRPGPAGIGEIGLDHWRARAPAARATQARFLRAQLALARSWDVPVALHCVRAWGPLAAILRSDGLPAAGGMVHGWSAGPGPVPEAVALGLHLSVGVRELRSRRGRAAAAAIPPGRLLLETDAPDAPLDGREHGEPVDLLHVGHVVAELRGEAPSTVLARAATVARSLWGTGRRTTHPIRIAAGPMEV